MFYFIVQTRSIWSQFEWEYWHYTKTVSLLRANAYKQSFEVNFGRDNVRIKMTCSNK